MLDDSVDTTKTRKFICPLDVETTGLDPEIHQITELCFVRMSFVPGTDWFSTLKEEARVCHKTLLRPGTFVDPTVASINKYDPEVWAKEAIHLADALSQALPLLRDAYPIASKPQFDMGFIAKAVKDLCWQMPRMAGHHPIDITSAFVRLYFEGKIDRIGQDYVTRLLFNKTADHLAEPDVDDMIKLMSHV